MVWNAYLVSILMNFPDLKVTLCRQLFNYKSVFDIWIIFTIFPHSCRQSGEQILEIGVVHSNLFVSLDGNTHLFCWMKVLLQHDGFIVVDKEEGRFSSSSQFTRFNSSLLSVTDQLEEFRCVCWRKHCSGLGCVVQQGVLLWQTAVVESFITRHI